MSLELAYFLVCVVRGLRVCYQSPQSKIGVFESCKSFVRIQAETEETLRGISESCRNGHHWKQNVAWNAHKVQESIVKDIFFD